MKLKNPNYRNYNKEEGSRRLNGEYIIKDPEGNSYRMAIMEENNNNI